MKGMKEWISKHGMPEGRHQTKGEVKGLKGSKQKGLPPEHGGWTKLGNRETASTTIVDEVKVAAGHQLEVEIARVETHRKSGEYQALAYVIEMRVDASVTVGGKPSVIEGDRYKIVISVSECYDRFEREPEKGERWRVTVDKVIPGIAFVSASEYLGESEALRNRRAAEAAKKAEETEVFRHKALGQRVELSISLPDHPHDFDCAEVWNRVDHIEGKLIDWSTDANVIVLRLDNVSVYRTQGDIDGGGRGHTRYLDEAQTFRLHGAEIGDHHWRSAEDGSSGTIEVLRGANPGREDWDQKRWQLIVLEGS